LGNLQIVVLDGPHQGAGMTIVAAAR